MPDTRCCHKSITNMTRMRPRRLCCTESRQLPGVRPVKQHDSASPILASMPFTLVKSLGVTSLYPYSLVHSLHHACSERLQFLPSYVLHAI